MDARIRQSERAVATLDGDDLVVVDLDTSELIVLGGTSRTLWECLAEGATIEELLDDVLGPQTDGDDLPARQRIRADVERFTAELGRLGLVTAESP